MTLIQISNMSNVRIFEGMKYLCFFILPTLFVLSCSSNFNKNANLAVFSNDPKVLEELSNNDRVIIRVYVAQNESTPLHVLERLFRDSDSGVVDAVLENPVYSAKDSKLGQKSEKLTKLQIKKIIESDDIYKHIELSLNETIPSDMIDLLVWKYFKKKSLWKSIINNSDLSPLKGTYTVLRNLVSHPNLRKGKKVLLKLLFDGLDNIFEKRVAEYNELLVDSRNYREIVCRDGERKIRGTIKKPSSDLDVIRSISEIPKLQNAAKYYKSCTEEYDKLISSIEEKITILEYMLGKYVISP